VVLMRKGTRTVLSMQNSYQGPPEAFAMVIPVPVVLQEGDVKTLEKSVFERVDVMGSPRLVEYWEQDPCFQPDYKKYKGEKVLAAKESLGADAAAGMAMPPSVTIEAKFAVGEYQILILSAKDSTGLDRWLRDEGYKIPAGAEPLLRPYVEGGSKFFVAKVDVTKVKFDENKRAALSPLRFHYDSDEFSLPIRLGLANSSGTQDLIVNILAPQQRYDVANYKNATIPTNIDLRSNVAKDFPAFYTALFDRTLEKNPGAVITEYAWQAVGCDPCPGPQLNQSDFSVLGADVLDGTADHPAAYHNADFVLTRLHARYTSKVTDDLRFRAAEPIVGGREVRNQKGALEERSAPSSYNNFQGRYAIRHQWTGAITCKSPKRGVWGGPPDHRWQPPKAAANIAFAPRDKVQLVSAIAHDVPEIDLEARASDSSDADGDRRGVSRKTADEKRKAGGCGCQTNERNDVLGGALLVGAILFVRRRRRPRGA
jgi:hypothetical protein